MYFIIHYQLCENADYGNHLLDFSKDQWLQIEELDHYTRKDLGTISSYFTFKKIIECLLTTHCLYSRFH